MQKILKTSLCLFRSKFFSSGFSSGALLLNYGTSPLDTGGQPVQPAELLQFLETNPWDRPSCFCAARGFPRKTVLLIPNRHESPAFGMTCLVCPQSECAYFGSSACFLCLHKLITPIVNVNELFQYHKNDVIAVRTGSVTADDTSPGDNGSDGQYRPCSHVHWTRSRTEPNAYFRHPSRCSEKT